jgi:predicted RNA-binding Zn-ribbon protein involved in translation (DUF1610 family)
LTKCQNCKADVTDAFLCRKCRDDLRGELKELPWWLERLTETALGQTRMSDNAGRKSAPRKDLDGDAELAACIEVLPSVNDLDKARIARQRRALAHALATGGINYRASELLAELADSLAFWCRILCEQRGLDYTPQPGRRALGVNHAQWLTANIDAIAGAEDAGDIAADILGRDKHRRSMIRQIEWVVNRPMRWWHLGPCPTPIRIEGPAQTGRPHPSVSCGINLRAKEGATRIRCPQCRADHNVHRLLWSRKSEAEAEPMTARELTRYNRDLPPEFQVPPRTLQHWLATGRLCACGEVSGDPLYSWIDVRLLAVARPQNLSTGAAAHRSKQ